MWQSVINKENYNIFQIIVGAILIIMNQIRTTVYLNKHTLANYCMVIKSLSCSLLAFGSSVCYKSKIALHVLAETSVSWKSPSVWATFELGLHFLLTEDIWLTKFFLMFGGILSVLSHTKWKNTPYVIGCLIAMQREILSLSKTVGSSSAQEM